VATRRTPFVVPVLVYLDNGAGSDVSDPAQNATAEILVPPVTNSHAGRAQSDTPALLQRTAQLLEPELLCDEKVVACGDLLKEVASWPRVAVVAPDAAPEISAPLGWVLSESSMDRMDAAMTKQATQTCAQVPNSLCTRGFGRLKDVLDLLDS
jgi:hypothetical protein